MINPFRQVEDEYFKLKGQLTLGRITRAQLDAALKELMIQDAHGRHWTLNVGTNKWNMYNGQMWVEANPDAAPAPPPLRPAPTSLPSPSPIRGEVGGAINWKPYLPIILAIAVMLGYVLLTFNFLAIIIGVGIGAFVRVFANQIDAALKPVWRLRNSFSSHQRKFLAWILPVAISFTITVTPLAVLFRWLPFVGPDTSLFIFTTIIAAFVAYVLVREPQLARG